MNQARPDLATARLMLKKAQKRQRIKRWFWSAVIVLVCAAAAAYLLLQTRLFSDVYRQLLSDLHLG